VVWLQLLNPRSANAYLYGIIPWFTWQLIRIFNRAYLQEDIVGVWTTLVDKDKMSLNAGYRFLNLFLVYLWWTLECSNQGLQIKLRHYQQKILQNGNSAAKGPNLAQSHLRKEHQLNISNLQMESWNRHQDLL
jgi:hypothetical protein